MAAVFDRPTKSAHPRVCGENFWDSATTRLAQGSSPRVRGKLGDLTVSDPTNRLIPACAGKTIPFHPLGFAEQAHPRVCGENHRSCPGRALRPGSSPRVRGKPAQAPRPKTSRRLIPACAGKTSGTSSSPSATPAHPRVCGENMVSTKGTARSEGSSPRVRGKPGRGRRGSCADRLIPACAGKTGALSASRGPARAHPRVCGENFLQ